MFDVARSDCCPSATVRPKACIRDEGLPALEGWLQSALKIRSRLCRVIPDEQALIEATLKGSLPTLSAAR